MRTGSIGLIMLGVSLAGSVFAGEHPWKKWEGCYQTLLRNGKKVPLSDQAGNESIVKVGKNNFLLDEKKNEIDSMNLVLFQKYDEDSKTYYFDIQFAFSTLGSYSQDSKGDHFQFDGKLYYIYCREGRSCEFTYHAQIDAKTEKDGNLSLHFYRKVDEVNDGTFDTDDTYLLKPVQCRK